MACKGESILTAGLHSYAGLPVLVQQNVDQSYTRINREREADQTSINAGKQEMNDLVVCYRSSNSLDLDPHA